MMKRERVDNRIERQMAMGAIMSTEFLKALTPIYNPKHVDVSFVRQVCDWSLEYFKQYGKHPGRQIEDIYHDHVRKKLFNNKEQSELIADFLEEISGEYARAEKLNIPYLIDQTVLHLKSRSLSVLSDEIESCLLEGKVVEAEGLLATYRRVEPPSASGINPFNDKQAIINAFQRENHELFSFPGPLGHMLNPHLIRDGLIGIMAPEKRGKTWMLMEFAIQAAKARCNVAFFEVGDMSEAQMVRRMHIRLAGRSDDPRYCGEFSVPLLDCEHNQQDTCDLKERVCKVGIPRPEAEEGKPAGPFNPRAIFTKGVGGYSPCTACRNHSQLWKNYKGAVWYENRNVPEPLTWRDGLRHGQSFMERLAGRGFKLSTHPTRTINVQGIKNQLDMWESFEGFIPDVIVIDYADILAPEDTKKEFRHQQNDTWAALRALSQEKHALVIAATQADAQSYETRSLKLGNFSEDKRKYAHVTGMLALNQEEIEKKMGLMRMAWLLLREGEFNVDREVKVLQCLQIGRPHLGSFI